MQVDVTDEADVGVLFTILCVQNGIHYDLTCEITGCFISNAFDGMHQTSELAYHVQSKLILHQRTSDKHN